MFKRKSIRNRERKKKKKGFCKFCSKIFADNYKLKQHYLSVHSNLKLYKCNNCHEEFETSSRLLVII